MITPTGSPARRSAVAAVLALAAAGLLAAGCGTASSPAATAGTPASPASSGQASAGAGGSASPAPAGSRPAGASGEPTPGGTEIGSPPRAAPTEVPTISGGTVPAGQVDCVGWPAKAPTVSLPVSFVPVSAERCEDGVTKIQGRGTWVTATMQKATGDLTALVNALHKPTTGHKPGTACPALAMIPPKVVLTNAAGQQVIPRLPASGCGLTQSTVLGALNALHWQPVSVRLVSPVPDGTAPTVTGSPRGYQTAGAAAPR